MLTISINNGKINFRINKLEKKMGRKLWISLAVGTLFLGAVPAWAATINVGPTGDYATIQAAVNAATGGDTIQVAAGTYSEHITIDKQLSLIGVLIRPQPSLTAQELGWLRLSPTPLRV